MAVALEQEIMEAIGLGMHYNWYNGSRSCGGRARQATGELSAAIKNAHDAGKTISAPDNGLIRLANIREPDEETLTRTWQACSYIIQAHIYLYSAKDAREKAEIRRTFTQGVRRLGPEEDMAQERSNVFGFI